MTIMLITCDYHQLVTVFSHFYGIISIFCIITPHIFALLITT